MVTFYIQIARYDVIEDLNLLQTSLINEQMQSKKKIPFKIILAFASEKNYSILIIVNES